MFFIMFSFVVLFLRRGDKSLFIDSHDDAMDCQPLSGFFLDFSEFFGGHSRQIFFRPDPDTAWIVTVPHWLQ